MKDLTPKSIALRISFLVALVVTVIVSITEFLVSTINWQVSLVIFPITFLTSYFTFLFTVEKFIYKKIKLIYRTIHRLKLKKSNDIELGLDKDILSQVNSEVMDWVKSNKQEIERLSELETFQRDFVGNVSHELKTPIFNIQGYLLTLLEGGLEDPNINRKYLEKANKSVDRMIDIVQELNEITKLGNRNLVMNIEKINIVDLAKDTVSSLEDQANKSEMSIVVQHQGEKPIMVEADYNKISQVMTNLIVNAIKYGKKQGEILVKFFDMHDNILIEVADNGHGIEEVHLPRLFERFYRTDKARAREDGGSGLGLAIVKHIIEAHHQTINVRSTVDVGSTFSFTLKKA